MIESSTVGKVMMNLLFRAITVLALSLAGVLAYMVAFEDQYIYFPDSELQQTPVAFDLPFEELTFRTSDGVMLHGWYMPHPDARFTVLHFHGNAGNISHRLHLYRRWHAFGLSVFAFDYRGYGKSEGKPGEDGLYEDGRAAWHELTDRLKTPPDSVIFAGRSLGSAVAANLSTEMKAAGLALETPFTSVPDMADHYYPWLPLRFFMQSRFDLLEAIKGNTAPLLIISAQDDEIVPTGMDERIFSAAGGPKTHHALPGGHNDFDITSSQTYEQAWRGWLAGLAGGNWIN